MTKIAYQKEYRGKFSEFENLKSKKFKFIYGKILSN